MTTNKLVIVGAGGFAREVVWLAREAEGPWDLVGLLDDDPKWRGVQLCGIPVVGPVSDWIRYRDAAFVVAVGSPRARRSIVARMLESGVPRFATLIHPSVRKSAFVDIGEGSIVTAGCILTTQVKVGRHVILNLATTVGHDTTIEDYVTVAPITAISGGVHLEAGSEVGTGAKLRNGIRVGRGAMVGMGAVVTKDVAPRDLVVGMPAKPARQLDEF